MDFNVLWLFSIMACNRKADFDYVDYWSATNEICRWSEWEHFRPVAWNVQEDCAIPAYPSKQCVDSVIADFGVDIDTFMKESSLKEPYSLVYSNCEASYSPELEQFLWAIRGFFTFELGKVSDIESNELIAKAFVDELSEASEESGAVDTQAAMYNQLATIISSVTLGPELNEGVFFKYTFNSKNQKMSIRTVDWIPFGAEHSAALMHEQAHVFDKPHVLCKNPYEGRVCDDDIEGSYGSQLATWISFYKSGKGEFFSYDDMEVPIIMGRINSFQDELGELKSEWREVDLEKY